MDFSAFFCLILCIPAVLSTGEVKKVSSEDPGIKNALGFAMDELNKISNNMYRYMAFETLDATKQVVSGMSYCVVAAIGTSTKCRNNREHFQASLDECPIEKKEMECRFVIWEQAWRPKPDDIKLTDHECVSGQDNHLSCSDKVIQAKRNTEEEEEEEDIQEIPQQEEKIRLAFNQFVDKYQKPYQSDEAEFEHRYGIFKENIHIAQLMQDKERGTAKYGITQFSDLTKAEFLGNYTMNGWGEPLYQMKEAAIPVGKAPESFDWRDHKVVSEIKNQGTCGSCWAFSTTGNIEGQWAIKKKKLISLSEQELVDCDKVDKGCNGGLPSNAYKQIIKLGGLESETEYPYRGIGGKCSFDKKEVDVYINGSVKISSNEDDMAAWLASNGPISIGINAMAMQFYLGGVAHPWKIFCNPKVLDHGVLIVGYGVKKSSIFGDTPYWIIKNSWGESWGVQGYYLIYRGDGSCGLNTMCTSATID